MSAFDFATVAYVDTLVWAKAPRRGGGVSAGKPIGNVTSNGYMVVGVSGSKFMVHRLVWEYFNGPIPEGCEIDHINGCRADNRIENLRLATRSQNSMNHKMHTTNSTGFKNIGTRTRGKCIEYVARIRAGGKVHMKSSVNLSTVQAWVETMRPQLHGEFANGGYH